MGNNASSSSKPTTPTTSAPGSAHGHHHGHESPRHHIRKDARNIITGHTHRSAAPPEPSMAQAQGSTVINRLKSLPPTAVSSLSGSPHSNFAAVHKTASSSDAKAIAGSKAAAVPESKSTEPKPHVRDEPTKPLDVPMESSSLRSHQSAHANDPVLIPNSSITDMYLIRPPRLPLPIDEEVHTPGSPITAPQTDLEGSYIEPMDSLDGITRKSSALSATTVDEEDGEELRVDKTRPVVQTKLEWLSGGDKVYVTGTIFQWNRKQRLHPIEGRPGCFSTTVYVLPGTHHVRFLVDGIMQTSPHLPTTVDFGNNLVNYIEVSPDEAHKKQISAPPAASHAEVQTAVATQALPQAQDDAPQALKPPAQPRVKSVPPPEAYRNQIPQYLIDFDQAEDSQAYQYAVNAIERLPNPPTLPGFLSKPILNAATLMKDDNSVLNMPNHTILNHLATSSIKNNILAVSATTRYRNKYVTTIVYKPTSSDEG
ncbi:related to SIP2 - dominant suppressor of some ts mutations in RPO21 and PRP4 [Fusarium torulosum]|uniref:Related to SIP2 - dominant suppressor of some ts mutations in RPO21 and PRP4 n=1 Tax=Fusarium torulosum TaxID=33205 RepID=A0AAE8MK67_9HYPO|nr:related to SIP2 - dominant suppressor of some ts mutations in RPO21 and PRP4 [Fusarium torulosum]